VPPFERLDRRALAHAARHLVPMLRRRGWFLMTDPDVPPEREVRRALEDLLDAIRDDDPVRDEHAPLWARVEPSGLVLVGVARRAFVVARVPAWGGLAARLLVR